MCSKTFFPRFVACAAILLSFSYSAWAQPHAISEAWKASSQSTATSHKSSAENPTSSTQAATNKQLSSSTASATAPIPVEPAVHPANPPLVLEAEATEIKSSKLAVNLDEELVGIEPPATFNATAYSLPGRTRAGTRVRRGVIAADPKVLPLGSVVHLKAGNYSGLYTVHDTGSSIKGKRIDVWMPSSREARSFGRQNVRLTVLKYGGSKKPKAKQ